MNERNSKLLSNLDVGKIIIIILSAILIGILLFLVASLYNYTPLNSEVISQVELDEFPSDTYVKIDNETGIRKYGSPTMMVTIEPIVKVNPNLRYWITTVKIKNQSQLNSAFSGDIFSLNIKEKTSSIANRHNAILAINGAACGFNTSGYVIRDGVVYRGTDLDCAPLVIDKEGNFKIYEYGKKNAEELLSLGARHTYDFGPDLIKDGNIVDYGDTWYKEDMQPRTAIGQKGSLEYVIIVVDGRSTKSQGMSCYDLAIEFQKIGCNFAYNLDGGGSSTLYFNGEVINEPSDFNGERNISDILYFIN
ncbi:phosphodiester glycosidase family protein [Clostridium sulfidigenes]|uniref:phosphodiester glycosidase family protein n=1 Tax=Clostridium sulfidigenes TaxID=318464 RepID=UPI003F8BB30A